MSPRFPPRIWFNYPNVCRRRYVIGLQAMAVMLLYLSGRSGLSVKEMADGEDAGFTDKPPKYTKTRFNENDYDDSSDSADDDADDDGGGGGLKLVGQM